MGLLGVVNAWASEQPQPGARRRTLLRLLVGGALVLTAPWASPLLLLLLTTLTGLGLVLVDYFGPMVLATGFPTIASRYTHVPPEAQPVSAGQPLAATAALPALSNRNT